MCFTYCRNRLLFLLLFIPFYSYAANPSQVIIDQALKLKLYDSYTWKNLLHVKDNTPSINDPSFLLSYSNFSLKNELQETIKSFFNTKYTDDRHAICKYPARYFWIKEQLNLHENDFPKVECISFNQYLEKTKANELKLVFVSENTSSPSSMMGHVFFKLSGTDMHNVKREHAVSFFTVIDTINLPSLFVRSTITGMKGFFLLRPYKEQIDRYLKEENRNIWEYSLNISEDEQRLIYYHFWELKDVKIKYLFTGFNCATIVHDMLSMISNKLTKGDHLWITPKDVIKDAKKHNMIKHVSLKASNEWQIKMLQDKLKDMDNSSFIDDLKNNDLKNIQFLDNQEIMFLQKELVRSYLKYLYSNHKINESKVNTINKIVNEKTKVLNDSYALDLSQYKDPLKTFDDTQASLSYMSKNNEKYFLLSFLPASNTINDDNREYFGESDLRIMELNLLINKEKVKLDSFNLYSMKSLLPWDKLTGGISSSLNISYEPHYDSNVGEYHAYNISVGIGYTKQYFNDIFVYSLFNVGIAYGKSKFYTYIYPEFGLLMYEIFDMKTEVNYKYIYNQYGSKDGYHNIKLEQSFFIDKKARIGVSLDYKSIFKENKTSYKFSYNYFF